LGGREAAVGSGAAYGAGRVRGLENRRSVLNYFYFGMV